MIRNRENTFACKLRKFPARKYSAHERQSVNINAAVCIFVGTLRYTSIKQIAEYSVIAVSLLTHYDCNSYNDQPDCCSEPMKYL